MSGTKRVCTTDYQLLQRGFIPLSAASAEGVTATYDIDLGARYIYEGNRLVALRMAAFDDDGTNGPINPTDFDLVDGAVDFELPLEIVDVYGYTTNYHVAGRAEIEHGFLSIFDARVRVDGSEGAVEDPIEGQTAYLESGLSLAQGDERARVLDVITRPFYNSSGVLTHLLLAAGGTAIFPDFEPNFEDERVWTAVPFDEVSGTTQPVALDAPFDLLRENEESFTGTDEVTYTVTSADKDEDGNVIGLSITLESQNATRVETAVTIDLNDEVRKASPDSADGRDADASAPADEPA